MTSGVMVVGMHRSGTSAVTRVINLMGVPLGRADDIYTANDNPSGHWESRTLCDLNDLILRAFGGFEMAMPPMPASWLRSRRAESLRDVMRASFQDVYRTERWLWKDPRICLTLPLWRQVLSDFCVVFVVRNAGPVTHSLNRREGWPLSFCYALWDDYNRRAVAGLSGLPVVRVDFDSMMKDPVEQVGRLADGLAALGVEVNHDVDGVAASLNPRPDSGGADELGRGHRLATVLRSGPEVAQSFRAPSLPPQPWWVRPALRARCSWLKVRERWTERVGLLDPRAAES
ncbi:MAG: sulfotransferase family protein [Solirubrobacteraceae bacterium]